MSSEKDIVSKICTNDSENINATVPATMSNTNSNTNTLTISEKTGENGEIIITYENCAYIYDTLNILSTIQEQDKLTVTINPATKLMVFAVDKPYIWQSVWRYWYGINRNMTVDYVSEFIDKYLCVAIDNVLSVVTSIKSEFVTKVRNYKEQRDNKAISSKLCKKQCKEASEAVKQKLVPYNNVLNELIINIRNGAEGIKRLNITYSTDIVMIEKLTNIYNKMYSIADKCDKERVNSISLE